MRTPHGLFCINIHTYVNNKSFNFCFDAIFFFLFFLCSLRKYNITFSHTYIFFVHCCIPSDTDQYLFIIYQCKMQKRKTLLYFTKRIVPGW